VKVKAALICSDAVPVELPNEQEDNPLHWAGAVVMNGVDASGTEKWVPRSFVSVGGLPITLPVERLSVPVIVIASANAGWARSGAIRSDAAIARCLVFIGRFP
jgi:hypothetical protein